MTSLINISAPFCTGGPALWLTDPHPNDIAIGEIRKEDAQINRQCNAEQARPNAEVEISRCSAGYFIYRFRHALDYDKCFFVKTWTVHAIKVSTSPSTTSSSPVLPSSSVQLKPSSHAVATTPISIHTSILVSTATLPPVLPSSSVKPTSSYQEVAATIPIPIPSSSPVLTITSQPDHPSSSVKLTLSSSEVEATTPIFKSSSSPVLTITSSPVIPYSSLQELSSSSAIVTTSGTSTFTSAFDTALFASSIKPSISLSIISSSILLPTTTTNKVMFTVKFTMMEWSPELQKQGSSLRTKLVEAITINIQNFYAGDSIFKYITVTLFRKGSVISDFNIGYAALDSIQILKLQEHVTMTGKISTIPAQILNISSDKVPNAPIITSATSFNSTSIQLNWTSVSDAGGMGYLVYYKEAGSRFDPVKFKSVLPAFTQTVISSLRKFTRYTFRVLASSSNGNGVASEPVTISTDEDVPSVQPSNFEIIVYSATRIGLVWDAIKDDQANGILLGYNVSLTWRDKMDNQLKTILRTVLPAGGSPMILLDDLQSNTECTFIVCGFTSKGCGPWSIEVIGRTLSDVPSQPPSNITYSNFTSTSSATIHWNPIPLGHVNGILQGYQLTYTLVTQSELDVEDGTSTTRFIGPNNRSLELIDLQAHSIYRVEIAGINDVGIGVAQTVYVETCRCPKTLYTNFWVHPPYLTQNTSTGVIDGIFPNIVTQMLTWACGVCNNGHGDTILNMTSNGRDMTSLKDSVVGVIEDIDDVPQVSFPIYGNKDFKEYKGSHQYVHVVDSPGIAFITVKEPLKQFAVTNVVIGCLPLLGLIMCMTFISGFAVWLLESRQNEQFPVKFTKGIREGFWWSFITITTVGYGDRYPISVIGRLFAILWTLCGLVTISILIGGLTASLTTVTMSGGIMIYGTKTTVIENSTEHNVGILKNAKIKNV
ncbi:uncharacterized protein LOC116305830 isoform X2 [Actinia tenebrosa]|uniref:Uncharacterized protein LOC116305830 isoform X2 n=1 Tax=Actinia tenebrosa TaxID=6105 RepID=A0A6P8J0F7_ACTTE|nr:uncharacterized protein LOC116305830 isoform X2 [Actinia tenebrosa]